jgi:hypothetical protein
MSDIVDLLHQVETLAAWTGLSLGALAGLAALGWFVAAARPLAIAAAVTVAAGYGGLLYGNHVRGAADQAEWDAKLAAAAKARAERDARIGADTAAQYQPQIEALRKRIEDRNQVVDGDEKKLLAAKIADKGVAGGGRCVLGTAALRLRARRN